MSHRGSIVLPRCKIKIRMALGSMLKGKVIAQALSNIRKPDLELGMDVPGTHWNDLEEAYYHKIRGVSIEN